MEVFSQFLRKEFSEENIEFWLACEEFKTIDSETKMLSKAKHIYTLFCEPDSPKEVSSPLASPLARLASDKWPPSRQWSEAANLPLQAHRSWPLFYRQGPGSNMQHNQKSEWTDFLS